MSHRLNPNPNPIRIQERKTRTPRVSPHQPLMLWRSMSVRRAINADRFVAFYQQKGWMVGKNHMKDWKAAVRTWHYRDNPKPPAEQKSPKWTYNSDTGGWTQEE